jgi:hypothetical protein
LSDAALVWGAPAGGLRLGIGSAGAVVSLALENTGERPLEVLSHVLAAGEAHYDWFTVRVDARELRLLDDRNRSAVVRATLAPGESLRHEVDLAAWAQRPVNGGEPLAPGAHELRARYEVGADESAWTGRLDAGPAGLTLA